MVIDNNEQITVDDGSGTSNMYANATTPQASEFIMNSQVVNP